MSLSRISTARLMLLPIFTRNTSSFEVLIPDGQKKGIIPEFNQSLDGILIIVHAEPPDSLISRIKGTIVYAGHALDAFFPVNECRLFFLPVYGLSHDNS